MRLFLSEKEKIPVTEPQQDIGQLVNGIMLNHVGVSFCAQSVRPTVDIVSYFVPGIDCRGVEFGACEFCIVWCAVHFASWHYSHQSQYRSRSDLELSNPEPTHRICCRYSSGRSALSVYDHSYR